MTDLCNNNKTLPLRFSVFCFTNTGAHSLYGRCVTSVREIEMGADVLELFSERNKFAGTITIKQFVIDMKPSLLLYMKSGWLLNTSMAIDFTLSNRPITDYRSLHYQNEKKKEEMNLYEKAMYEVGMVLEPYAFQRQFTMFGFGGIPQYLTNVAQERHEVIRCWNLLGDLDRKKHEDGLELKVTGIMQALGLYNRAVHQTELAGPTYFSTLLKRLLKKCKYEMERYNLTFQVMVILTDGAIHDMDATKELVVELSYLPVSIVIVGIGDGDFDLMQVLDADSNVLCDSNGRPAARDIIQFVHFKELKDLAQVEVINEILKEVPDQFVDYMVLKKITPDYNYVQDEEENANMLDINNLLESQRSEAQTSSMQANNIL